MPGLPEIFNTKNGELIAKDLSERYINNQDEKARQRASLERRQLFQTNGYTLLCEMIDDLFIDATTQAKYKKAAKYAKFDYALTRIVKTLGTVYNAPAVRHVEGDSNDANYQALLKATRHDEIMREFNYAMLTHNDVYLSFRVRSADRVPVTEFVTPDRFWAVAHPDDAAYWVAIILDQKRPGAKDNTKRYLVWTDTDVTWLSGEGKLINSEPHSFGQIPGILSHMYPVQGALLDPFTGQDMIDATKSALFEQVLMVKESKSVTAQLLLSGDMSTTASGQAQDTEVDVITGEGVGAQRIERGIGLEQFQNAADYIVERAAANRGIGPDILRHAGAASGLEIKLRRMPMEEVRQQQVVVMRPVERAFAELQSKVLKAEGDPEYVFTPEGWRIDFAEVARHMTQQETYAIRKLKRSSGHSNVFTEAMEDNPDLTPDQAKDFVLRNQELQAAWVLLARALNMSPDADQDDPGASPEDNGAANAEAPVEEPVIQ